MTTNKQKYYSPSTSLVNYLDEKLRIEKEAKELKHKGQELSVEDERKRKLLHKQKFDMLDKVFRSVADLTYLLEMVAAHEELREVLEDDIKDLFDVGSEYPVNKESPLKSQETVLERMLIAILLLDYAAPGAKSSKDEESVQELSQDSTLKMVHVIQRIVMHKTLLELFRVYGNNRVTESAAEDMEKALGWTHFVSSRVQKEEREQGRKVKVPKKFSQKKIADPVLADLLYTQYAELASPL